MTFYIPQRFLKSKQKNGERKKERKGNVRVVRKRQIKKREVQKDEKRKNSKKGQKRKIERKKYIQSNLCTTITLGTPKFRSHFLNSKQEPKKMVVVIKWSLFEDCR